MSEATSGVRATDTTAGVHRTTCPLCEAMCGLKVTLDGGQVRRIEGDPEDPLSLGHICPKGAALADLHHDPDRLKTPLIRTAEGFREASWDEALDHASALLRGVRERHGRDAVGLYLGNPNVHSLGTAMAIRALTRGLRTRNRFSATSVDQLPHHLASYLVLGHQFLIPVPDIDHTNVLVILGANPVVSGGSLWTVPGFERRAKALQARGGELWVVDPRRTRTAAMADTHLFVRPGTDAWLLAALVREVLQAGPTLGHLAAHVDGLEALRTAMEPFDRDRASRVTGIASEAIARLAAALLSGRRAAVYGRMGLSTQPFGAVCQWLILVLNTLTGNLDVPGGMAFTTPALDIVEPRRAGSFARYHSRVRGLPEFAGELPVATLADEIETPGDGQIRAMVTVAGNPVLSTPDGRRLDAAFDSLDAYVAIDIYQNETTRHADVILPTTTGLENERYDVIFHHFAVRNTAKFSPPVCVPGEEQRPDWWVFRELARRLHSDETPFETGPLNTMTPAKLLDYGLKMGPHDVSLRQLTAHPSGLDLGPLTGHQLPDRSGRRLQLAPDALVADLERVLSLASDTDAGGLLLIGRRELRTNNSWLHNAPRLVKGKPRCTVRMHPDDAASRGLSDGVAVEVTSRIGAITLPLEITDEVMPGVISIPHGYGHDRGDAQASGQTVARGVPGPSVNDITDPSAIDVVSGNAALNGLVVEVGPA